MKVFMVIMLCLMLLSGCIQQGEKPKTYLGLTSKDIEEHYGETGPPGWIPEDLNSDGVVDYLDVSLFVSHVGKE